MLVPNPDLSKIPFYNEDGQEIVHRNIKRASVLHPEMRLKRQACDKIMDLSNDVSFYLLLFNLSPNVFLIINRYLSLLFVIRRPDDHVLRRVLVKGKYIEDDIFIQIVE